MDWLVLNENQQTALGVLVGVAIIFLALMWLVTRLLKRAAGDIHDVDGSHPVCARAARRRAEVRRDGDLRAVHQLPARDAGLERYATPNLAGQTPQGFDRRRERDGVLAVDQISAAQRRRGWTQRVK